jgi:hypothetical protein
MVLLILLVCGVADDNLPMMTWHVVDRHHLWKKLTRMLMTHYYCYCSLYQHCLFDQIERQVVTLVLPLIEMANNNNNNKRIAASISDDT